MVVSTTAEDLRRFARYSRFENRHGRNLKGLRNASTDRSRRYFAGRVDAHAALAIWTAKRTLLDDSLVWYYARRLEGGHSSETGRYHVKGERTWYVARDRKTAAIEALRGSTSGAVEILEERLGNPFFVLDLRERVCSDYPFSSRFLRNLVALSYLSEAAPFGQSGGVEYRVPQLLARWARHWGIHGILYTSTRFSPYGSEVGGDCLAMLHTAKVVDKKPLGIFQFSGPRADINFPENTWQLIPASTMEIGMHSRSAG